MKLVFATHNKNKLIEVKAFLPSYIEILSLSDIGCHDEIPETSSTIEGNARLKALYVKENYGYNCFADDTGLEVASLNNAPGVFSARYGGPEKDPEINKQKLLDNLLNKTDRRAQFKTAISLIVNDEEELFIGICEGEITKEQKGEKGFGYDPIFKPIGCDRTFAEMSLEQKNAIGHRGKAVRLLCNYIAK